MVKPEHVTDPGDVHLRLWLTTHNLQHLGGYLQIMRARHVAMKAHIDALERRIGDLEANNKKVNPNVDHSSIT